MNNDLTNLNDISDMFRQLDKAQEKNVTEKKRKVRKRNSKLRKRIYLQASRKPAHALFSPSTDYQAMFSPETHSK